MGIEDSGFNRKMKMQKRSIPCIPITKALVVPYPHSHPPRPHDEIRRVQRGLSERMQRTSLRQRTVVIAQYGWEISIVRAVELRSGYRLQATAEASAEAAFPVPPRESPRYFAAVG